MQYLQFLWLGMASTAVRKDKGAAWKTSTGRGRRGRKVNEYPEIGTHLKGYLEEDVQKALRLVSSCIGASEVVVEVIKIYNIKPLPHKWLNLKLFEALKL